MGADGLAGAAHRGGRQAERGTQGVARAALGCAQAAPEAPMNCTAFLTRADLASHLALSVRSVDRFIERHRLKSGGGRAVLVPVDSYAWCLGSLRRESTRSLTLAPAVTGETASPQPLRTGEELVLVAKSDGFNASGKALRSLPAGCELRTLHELPEGHWGWSVVEAAKTMANVHAAMARGASRPETDPDSTASRYLRQFLREAQASTAKALDPTVLARSLRQLPADNRRLLLEAVSGELADAARENPHAPLAYAREPLLTENELASEVRRTLATVRRWRVEGTGPVFMKIDRAVRYSRVDVDRWMGRRSVR